MKKYFTLGVTLILFSLGAYSQSPDWQWAKNTGGVYTTTGRTVLIDPSGNVTTVGYFADTVDFDPGPMAFNMISAGGADVFITKFDNAGSFLWAKSFGGPDGDFGVCAASDAAGNILITGYFVGTSDFDPGPGVFNLTSVAGTGDIYIAKLNSAGNFLWAKTMGGTSMETAKSIATDAFGNIYTTGTFQGTADFFPGAGTFNLTSAGGTDIFISKMNASGNYVWSKRIGGIDWDGGTAIAVDADLNVFTAGYFRGTVDFDPNLSGIYNLTSSGIDDVFISKLDSSGNFVWARGMGGLNVEYCSSIALDMSGSGAVYSTGYFSDTVDFDPDPSQDFILTSAGSADIFISKLDSSGHFIWAKGMGGTDDDRVASIAVGKDPGRSIYTTGSFFGIADFNPDSAVTFNQPSTGGADIFVSKSDSSGAFVWTKVMGGTSSDWSQFINTDDSGHVYLTGYFSSPAVFFDSILLVSTAGTSDLFVAKLGTCSTHFTLFPDSVPHNWFALNEASGLAPVTYTWNWGDGTSSTGPYPSHTYIDSGYYNICLTIQDAAGCNSTYCDSSTLLFRGSAGSTMVNIAVVAQIPTSIEVPVANAEGITIYPNPGNTLVTIHHSQFSMERIELYNMLGEKIGSQDLSGQDKHQAILDATHLPAGMYFVKVFTVSGTATLKFLKD